MNFISCTPLIAHSAGNRNKLSSGLRYLFMAIMALITMQTSSYAQCIAWSTESGAAVSSTTSIYTALAIDGAGNQYVAYNDGSNSNKISVKKYNGTSWSVVGVAGFSVGEAQLINISIGKNDTPFVAFQDRDLVTNRATVMKFDGTNWVVVGVRGFSPAQVNDLAMAINSLGEAYVSYKDNSVPSGRISVMKFNYGTDAWEQVGAKSFSTGNATNTGIAFNSSDVPYVIYTDVANSNKVAVKKFTTGSWGDEGSSTSLSVGVSSYCKITFDGDIPYIAYADAGAGISGKIVVKKFESSAWSFVGSASGNSLLTATYCSIAMDGSTPYIAYSDAHGTINSKVVVKKLSAGSFVAVGTATGLSVAAAQYNNIKIHAGNPYIAFMDVGDNSKAYAMEYAATPVAISGSNSAFIGRAITLTDATASGTWSSTNTAVATVGSATGVVLGISAGNTTISYTTAGPCAATKIVTVSTPQPALNFDGTSDYVSLGSILTSGNSYTKEAWIKPSALSATSNNILSAADHVFRIANGHISASNNFTGAVTTVTDAATLNVNEWVHVAVTYDAPSTTLTLYKNGVVVATTAAAASYTAAAMQIGAYENTASTYFQGSIDEVRVWNVARSQAEIQAAMDCDVATAAALQGYYRFDQGTVAGTNTLLTNAYDYSGNGNCGTLNTFALTGATSNYVHGAIGTCNTITIPALTVSSNVTICNGNNTTLIASGGSTYTWTPSTGLSASTGASVIASPTTTTTYTVSASSGACNITATVQVSVNPVPTVSAGSNVTICNGSTTALTASGATTYTWAPGTGLSATTGANVNANPSSTTIYTVIGTSNSCTNTATVQVSVNPVPTVSGGSNVTICFGNTTTLTATGATTYVWTPASTLSASTGASVVSSTTATATYTVIGTSGSCTNNATVQVSVNTLPTVSAGLGETICAGSSATLTGTGASTYVWSPAASLSSSTGTSVTATPAVATSYTVIGTDANGCNDTAIVGVLVSPLPTIASATGNTVCAGGNTTVNAVPSSGSFVSWYSLATGGSFLGFGSALSITGAPSSNTDYFAESNTLTGSSTLGTAFTGSNTYRSVGFPIVVANPIAINSVDLRVGAGTSNVSIYYRNGGVNSGNIQNASGWIFIGDVPISTVSAGNVNIPFPSSLVLTPGTYSLYFYTTNGVGYIGSGGVGAANADLTIGTGQGTFGVFSSTVLSPTTPKVIINYSASIACTSAARTSATLTVNPLPTISGGSNATVCAGSSTTLTASGGTTYTWSPAASLSASTGVSVTATPSGTTTYTVTGTLSGCSNTSTVTVSVTALPAVSGGSDATICAGGSTSLTASGATTYVWSPSTGLSATTGTTVTANPATTTIYTVIGTQGACTNSATVQVSVNPLPTIDAGSGVTTCLGVPTTITATGGSTYNWSPGTGLSATTGASVDASPATTTTYTVTGTLNGCSNTATKTVSISAPVISASGAATVCNGGSTTLTGSGGTTYTWSPGTGLSATTGASVTAAPSVTTIYTVTGTLAGCDNTATVQVSVNPLPTVNPGAGIEVCSGVSNVLTASGATTYTWAPSTGLSATTGANVLANVTSDITYTITGTLNGCSATATKALTVNALPTSSFTTSNDHACPGVSISFSNTSPGTLVNYAWNFGDGFTDNGTDVTHSYTAVAIYSASLTVTDTKGCVKTSTAAIHIETVMPGGNVGLTEICVNQPFSIPILTNSTPGGTWSSSDIHKVKISSSTGVAKGVSPGTANITYHLGSSCGSVSQITVNPAVALITGPTNVCPGLTTTLFDVTPSGTWVSSNAAIASVGSTTGIVSGLSEGSATITYQVNAACIQTRNVYVAAQLLDITGDDAICQGSTSQYISGPVLGSWTSSNLTAATVDAASGVVTAVGAGVTTLTYTATNGCYLTKSVTVNGLAAVMSGMANICTGSTTDLNATVTGGVWTSSNPSIATVNSSDGVVTGINGGTAIITYAVASGCFVTTVQTVYPAPASVAGPASICMGTAATYTSGLDGGTWSSSAPSIATMSASGSAIALASGPATITYTSTNGCIATKNVTVATVPAAITGTFNVCVGAYNQMTSTPLSGVWSSSNTVKASIDATSGMVNGLSAGTANITYSNGGCYSVAMVTVYPVPTAISGANVVCEGSYLPLSIFTASGTWTSSNTSAATVNATSGVVYGIAAGVTNVNYIAAGGCSVTSTVSVNPSPAAITGTFNVCVGSNVNLSSTTLGGIWTSNNPSKAYVTTTGQVNGLAVGTATIVYVAGGCSTSAGVTVAPLPSTITGLSAVCVGSTILLSSTPGGGTWSTADPYATVSASGVVSGVSEGVTTISYQLGSGCAVTKQISVNAAPSTIGGATAVCIGSPATLIASPTGGSWSSSTTRASINPTSGMVTGYSAGTTIITYALPNGCKSTLLFTVNSVPAAITGPSTVCIGFAADLNSSTIGGTWISSDDTKVTVDAGTGAMNGIAAGSAVISYVVAGGCQRTKNIDVNVPPSANEGYPQICLYQPASQVILTNSTPGGTWSASSGKVAISPASGIMKGKSVGTVTISYKISNGCYAVSEMTVNAAVSNNLGGPYVCVDGTTELSNTTPGGTWSSSSSILSIGLTDGMVTGVTSGATTISYIVSEGCFKTSTMIVNPAPSPIGGPSSVVIGTPVYLYCTPTGGAWNSYSTAVATIHPITGLLTGYAPGTALIKYVLSTGCYVTKEITVTGGGVAKGAAVNQPLVTAGFAMFPNPTSGTLTVEAQVPGTFMIYGLDAKLVKEFNITDATTTISLANDLAPGVYMCRFQGNDGSSFMAKLVYKP